jgi:protein gp37
MYEEYAGKAGWAKSFNKPTIFPERVAQSIRWHDLSYTNRGADKPWLNGMPRLIFLNDMGDGFTRELDLMWMAEYIPLIEKSPHIFIMLTKRVKRMADFWMNYGHEHGKIPDNVWLGTSITSGETLSRASILAKIPAATRFLSIEPLIDSVSIAGVVDAYKWVIVGGESGRGCRDMSPRWARTIRDECLEAGVPFFMKQMGGIKDHKGRMSDLPEDLRIRQMPAWEHLEWTGKTPKPAMQLGLI